MPSVRGVATKFIFHLLLRQKVEPSLRLALGRRPRLSRSPTRTGPQHELPELGATAQAVGAHRTLHLSTWRYPESGSAINSPCNSLIDQVPRYVEVGLTRSKLRH